MNAFLLFVLAALLWACGDDNPVAGGGPTPYLLDLPAALPPLESPADNPLTVEGVALGERLFFDPILSVDSTVACASPVRISPLANMPARAAPPAGRSTYTSALRLLASSVGASMRTVPLATLPSARRKRAACPGATAASCSADSSARHSSRPWRTMPNSSVPDCTTLPSVALRRLMMPSSGATMRVWPRRICSLLSAACAAARLALALCSATRYCCTCWADSAPLPLTLRARSALPRASSSAARACATMARCWASLAATVSRDSSTRVCPRLTTSPTSAATLTMRRPPVSAAITASCHGATLPLALIWRDQPTCATPVTLTAMAARAAGFSTAASAG